MAYMRRVVNTCYRNLCNREGRWEVFDRWNSSLGKFCKHHGEQKKREQQRHETHSINCPR